MLLVMLSLLGWGTRRRPALEVGCKSTIDLVGNHRRIRKPFRLPKRRHASWDWVGNVERHRNHTDTFHQPASTFRRRSSHAREALAVKATGRAAIVHRGVKRGEKPSAKLRAHHAQRRNRNAKHGIAVL